MRFIRIRFLNSKNYFADQKIHKLAEDSVISLAGLSVKFKMFAKTDSFFAM